MASPVKKAWASQFTTLEMEVLIATYAEYEQLIQLKGNTVAAAKKQDTAWQKLLTESMREY